jgi:hypothetical protein
LSDPASNKRPLAWDPEMDEVPDRPPFMFMIDSYFTVYQGRRLGLLGNYWSLLSLFETRCYN